jgi:3-mercaptopyruvate sulfurtransferase SseA
MRHKSLIAAVMLITAAVILIGCNANDHQDVKKLAQVVPAGGPQTEYADGASRITIAEFDELVKEGKAYVVDVRNQAAYDDGHIPGAILIPAGEILNHVNELPRDKMIVTYCS